MTILGIDPGLRFAGFAIIKKEQGRFTILECGCLKLNPTAPLIDRIGQFHEFFKAKIIQFEVTAIALETPFLGKNAQTFLKLGYLRGILYLLVYHTSIHIIEFSPTQIKQAVTGFGGAQKEQVARALQQIFPSIKASSFERYDMTDALAITLCGAWHHKQQIKGL